MEAQFLTKSLLHFHKVHARKVPLYGIQNIDPHIDQAWYKRHNRSVIMMENSYAITLCKLYKFTVIWTEVFIEHFQAYHKTGLRSKIIGNLCNVNFILRSLE